MSTLEFTTFADVVSRSAFTLNASTDFATSSAPVATENAVSTHCRARHSCCCRVSANTEFTTRSSRPAKQTQHENTSSRFSKQPSPVGSLVTLARRSVSGFPPETWTGIEPATARLTTWCPTVGRPLRCCHVQNPFAEHEQLTSHEEPIAPPVVATSSQA